MSFLCKLNKWGDFTKIFVVRKALKGLKRLRRGRDTRRPVSWDILKAMLSVLKEVCKGEFECRLFKLAFCLAFFGAFRLGEVVSPARGRPGGLDVSEVVVSGEGARIVLRRSKTDQLGRGKMVCMGRLIGCESCPVEALEGYLGVRAEGLEGPLLVHQDGTFLSRFQFVAVFKQCLDRIGLSAEQYCSHSFRIGAATEAVRLGLPKELVKRIGRWESRRFSSYVSLARWEAVSGRR